MSRLTDLIARAKAKDRALGDELDREFKALASRRAFGLNFERHRPESVELPGRPIRRGDKVRILPPRGSSARSDQRLWKVLRIDEADGKRKAHVSLIDSDEPDTADVATDDLVVVAEFRDYIYPGLVSTGKVECGGDKPYHTVINGENFHALEALSYTHRGKVDAIYIDPPYNTGARDWKYNNDYVEGEDLYRHSKWLAFMERRLKAADALLKKDCSVLIVTIDEKEYLRLGLLIEQVFPEANIQMVSVTISPRSTSRAGEFSRVDEFVYFVFFGSSGPLSVADGEEASEVRWLYLRRTQRTLVRGSRKNQFYPIYVDPKTKEIVKVGEPLGINDDLNDVPQVQGAVAVYPVNQDGEQLIWGLTGPSLRRIIEKGFVRVSDGNEHQPFTIAYLSTSNIKKVESGEYLVQGERSDGSKIVVSPAGSKKRPTTVWREARHDAGAYGTSLLRTMMPKRRFPFPKSLYAVEDALRIVLGENKSALVLDFFAGSGTTAHAVMRLNRQDGGRRRCISVTNNEVAADEQAALRKSGLRPGDPDWEKWGICDYITKPRIRAAITGRTPEGDDIDGDYKFTDEFPMAEGFEENAEFFTLTYETPVAVHHNLAFQRIAPLLWMRAGAEGYRIDTLPEKGWAVADTYGLLVDLDRSAEFCDAVDACEVLRIAYIVTDDDRRFQSVARRLPDSVEPIRLYESYLSNFRFSMGR
ncbi:site-specific DNA-methyltransferase [Amorphus orientalis]|uniref:site-specific DNA-methyltransferase (adenine-specific) n=1 Tax=Amorphus orientalis TaxID=649198 RepID=A0AAE3VP46_9HYPH|nr:DNA methyltransferase [Amorphus orientalis]MDQ0315517.1 adenine-specific DNA-methyltransferase [Amorphus orientalis]